MTSRYYKTSEPIFGDWTSLVVENNYDKSKGGYIVSVRPEKIYKSNGIVMCEACFSVSIHIKDLNELVAPCERRSKKKEEIVDKEVKENAEKYVKKFLELNKKENLEFEEYSV